MAVSYGWGGEGGALPDESAETKTSEIHEANIVTRLCLPEGKSKTEKKRCSYVCTYVLSSVKEIRGWGIV